jgi:predicted MPP superfamily phosphohydrolase
MNAWRRRFTLRVALVTLASQLPLALTLGAWAAERARVGVPLLLALAPVALAIVNLPLALRLRDWRDVTRRSFARVWLLELPYFALFAGAAFFALASLPVALVTVALRGALLDALLYAAAISMGVGLYSVFARRLWTPVATVLVEVDGLDPGLDGLTIVQLSDVHCGPYLPRWYLRRLGRRASALGAHAIVLTGDMITEGEGYLEDVTWLCDHLRAPRGVFACMGNHDYFGTTDGVVRALESGGATVLRNDSRVLRVRDGGPGVLLAGVDDAWTGHDDLARALQDKGDLKTCVLLAHDPDPFDRYVREARIDLMLSGHTHAGQVGVPFVTHRFNLGRVRFARSVGLSRTEDGRSALFVHPGNGTSGPPVRLGVAPVIARITLRATGRPVPTRDPR